MKPTILFVVALIQAGYTLANSATTKFTIKAIDIETGCSVSNAVAKVDFILKYDPWGANKNEYNQKKISVNTDGIAVIEGETIRRTGGGASVFANGYYSDGDGFPFSGRTITLNRWKPWNPTLEIKMRPKKNPVSMVYKKIFRIKPPENGKSIGFDLEKGDWVSPYGKGIISDFIFNISLSESPKKGAKYILSFSNTTDGIQEYLFPKEYDSSEFKWPYKAPLNGYDSNMSRFAYYMFPNQELKGTDLKSPINYIFRVRSKKNENGDLIGSYGMIKGELQIEKENALYFEYWFNPVPNERSLEYSGENLLKKKK